MIKIISLIITIFLGEWLLFRTIHKEKTNVNIIMLSIAISIVVIAEISLI